METHSWSRLSAASKRHQPVLHSRHDAYFGFDEVDGGEDDGRSEFSCPFCSEHFDVVGLCCHIDDEHPVEARNGVCPVCAARVGMDVVGHITTEHASFFKVQHRRRYRKGSSGFHSTHSLFAKDLHEGNDQTLLGGSFAPSNAAPDPLLSSFIFNLPMVDPLEDERPEPLDVGRLVDKISDEKLVESVEPSPLAKDQEESTRRSEFVRQLVLSTIFDNAL